MTDCLEQLCRREACFTQRCLECAVSLLLFCNQRQRRVTLRALSQGFLTDKGFVFLAVRHILHNLTHSHNPSPFDCGSAVVYEKRLHEPCFGHCDVHRCPKVNMVLNVHRNHKAY